MFFRKLLVLNLILTPMFTAQAAPSQFIDSLWHVDAGDVIAAGPITGSDEFDVLTQDKYGQTVLVSSRDGTSVPSMLSSDPSRSHLVIDAETDGQIEILTFSSAQPPGPLTLSSFDGHTVATRWSVIVPGFDRIDSIDVANVAGDADLEVLVHSDGNLFVYNLQNGTLIYNLCADVYRPMWWSEPQPYCQDQRVDSTTMVDVDGDGKMEILAQSQSLEGHAQTITIVSETNDGLKIKWSVNDVELVGHSALVTAGREDIIVLDGQYGAMRVLSSADGTDLVSNLSSVGALDKSDLRFIDSNFDGVMELLLIDRSYSTATSMSLLSYAVGQMQTVWRVDWPVIMSTDNVQTAQLNDDSHLELVVQVQGNVKIIDAVTGKVQLDTADDPLFSGAVQLELKDWDGDGVSDVLAGWAGIGFDNYTLALLGDTDQGIGIKWQRKETLFPSLWGTMSASTVPNMVVITDGVSELIEADSGETVAPMPKEFHVVLDQELPGEKTKLLDVNCDGRLEIVRTCSDMAPCLGTVYSFDGYKVHRLPTAFTKENVAVDNVSVADFDGDGISELVYTTRSDDRQRLVGGVYVANSTSGKILFDSTTSTSLLDSNAEVLMRSDRDNNGAHEVMVRFESGQIALFGFGQVR